MLCVIDNIFLFYLFVCALSNLKSNLLQLLIELARKKTFIYLTEM